MPTRDLPPQTGAGSPREIYGEYGVDGGYSDPSATVLVNPKPKSIYEHMDRIWTGLVGKRASGRAVEPDEMALVPARAVTASGAVSATTDERRLIVGNSASTITLTLPALATVTSGWTFEVLNIGAGTVTLDPNGSELIAGVATLDFPTGTSARLIADTTLGWRVLGREAIARVPGISSSGQGFAQWDAFGRIVGFVASVASIPRALMPPAIVVANNATDLTNDIDVGALGVRSDDDTTDIVLSTTWTKQIDAVFAEGNNLGGRATADNLTGAKWFHVWVIGGSGKTSQPFFSTSLTPTLPTGFTIKRRIWSIWWNGSAIERFTKVGLNCYWRTWLTDVASVTPVASRTLFALTVPPVDGVVAHVQVYMTSTVGILLHPDGADVAPSFAVNGSWTHSYDYAIGSVGSFQLSVPTNASRQVAHRAAAASGTWGLQTRGYTDTAL